MIKNEKKVMKKEWVQCTSMSTRSGGPTQVNAVGDQVDEVDGEPAGTKDDHLE